MPTLTEKTKEQKAQRIAKVFADSGFNEHEMARRLGISSPAARKQVQKPWVQKEIDKHLKKAGITLEKVYEKINDHLDSDSMKFQAKAYETVLKLKRHLTPEDKNTPPVAIQINYGYRGEPAIEPDARD